MKTYYEMLKLTQDGWEITQFDSQKEVMDELSKMKPTRYIKVRRVTIEEIDILFDGADYEFR